MNENNLQLPETGEKEKTAFLSLRHLEKVYGNKEKAVYDFNLDIERNEFIVIVGPSGCGKSTTLRMISGLEDISSGDIYMEDELLNYKPCKDRKMAIVFQSYALYPQMTVYQNIAFPLTINAYPFPVVNRVLLACGGIEKMFESVNSEAVFSVLSECCSDKELKRNKTENIATRLDIPLESAKLLLRLAGENEGGISGSASEKAEILKREILSRTAQIASEERQKLKENHTEVDGEYRELDENGAVKIAERKMSSYEIERKVYETAEILDLVPYLDKLPKQLSGGQMQRVALGRAIVKNVPVFLMDEPLSNLDAKLRLTMRSEIVKLHNRIHATTIYVTHDQTEAMTMATRIVVMSKGYIQQIGSPEEIYSRPANIFVAKFIGSPSMNVFGFSFNREKGCLEYGELRIKVGKDFIAKHDAFYVGQEKLYRGMLENFDNAASEYLMKVLSATGESLNEGKDVRSGGKSLVDKLKSRFKKDKTNASDEATELKRGVAARKAEELKLCLTDDHKILVGIRPERLRIEKYDGSRKYENCIVLKPTVCELLGAEYNVHFDYRGKDIVGRVDAKEKLTVNDSFAICFPAEDIYVFDPISGVLIE